LARYTGSCQSLYADKPDATTGQHRAFAVLDPPGRPGWIIDQRQRHPTASASKAPAPALPTIRLSSHFPTQRLPVPHGAGTARGDQSRWQVSELRRACPRAIRCYPQPRSANARAPIDIRCAQVARLSAGNQVGHRCIWKEVVGDCCMKRSDHRSSSSWWRRCWRQAP
jgi:hypothetical protein